MTCKAEPRERAAPEKCRRRQPGGVLHSGGGFGVSRGDAIRDPGVDLVRGPAHGLRTERHRTRECPALDQVIDAAGRQPRPRLDCGEPENLDLGIGIACVHEVPLVFEAPPAIGIAGLHERLGVNQIFQEDLSPDFPCSKSRSF